jgi:membrane-bound serine protease (ClpP class)
MTRKKIITLVFICLLLYLSSFSYGEPASVVEVLTLEGTINPVAVERLDKAIESAVKNKAQCLIIQLDTPGGLDKSMREMVKLMMNSEIPVVVYVGPRGSRAASAGVFLTLAAHIAAMAPGTNIGAAHPVALGVGGAMDKEMMEKVVNDAAAYVKSIAEKRNRNVEWAEKAVRESVSITADEALELGVVDIMAEDMSGLLEKLDGAEVEIMHETLTVMTKGASLHYTEMSFREKILQAIADPNLAYILLMVGIWGIVLEFFHPGALLPGIVGGICLILAFFALQILSFNMAGLVLIVLAIILFVLDIKVPSYGALTIGGIISLALGSLMLIDPSAIYISISLKYIIIMVAFTSALFIFIISYAIKAQFKKPTTGLEGMVGSMGIAKVNLKPKGKVQIHGEIWNAVIESGEEVIRKGEEVEVVRVDGMRLVVKKREV